MKLDRIASIVFFVFGSVVAYEATTEQYMTSTGPGAGFFPLWIGIIIMVLSITLFLTTRRSDTPFTKNRSGLLKAAVVAISFPVYGHVMSYLGLIVSLVLYLIFLIGVVERKGWRQAVFVAVPFGLGSYLLFEAWLGVQLPKGMIGL